MELKEELPPLIPIVLTTYIRPHEKNQRFKLHYGDLTDSMNLVRLIDEKGYDKSTGKCLLEVDKRYFRPTEVETIL